MYFGVANRLFAMMLSFTAVTLGEPIHDLQIKTQIIKAILDRPCPKNAYIKYTLTQKSGDHPELSGAYELYRDGERHYIQGNLMLMNKEEVSKYSSSTIVRSWNGERYQSMDVASGSGRISANDAPTAFKVIPDAIFGQLRFDESLQRVLASVEPEGMEISRGDGDLVSLKVQISRNAYYEYVFNEKLQYAVVSASVRPVKQDSPDQGKSIEFSDFQLCDGYYMPMHGELRVHRRGLEAHNGKSAVVVFTAELIRVDKPDIDDRLRGFDFPKDTKVWDEVLQRPLVAGREMEETQESLAEDALAAEKTVAEQRESPTPPQPSALPVRAEPSTQTGAQTSRLALGFQRILLVMGGLSVVTVVGLIVKPNRG